MHFTYMKRSEGKKCPDADTFFYGTHGNGTELADGGSREEDEDGVDDGARPDKARDAVLLAHDHRVGHVQVQPVVEGAVPIIDHRAVALGVFV
jgi:hypothetical protein